MNLRSSSLMPLDCCSFLPLLLLLLLLFRSCCRPPRPFRRRPAEACDGMVVVDYCGDLGLKFRQRFRLPRWGGQLHSGDSNRSAASNRVRLQASSTSNTTSLGLGWMDGCVVPVVPICTNFGLYSRYMIYVMCMNECTPVYTGADDINGMIMRRDLVIELDRWSLVEATGISIGLSSPNVERITPTALQVY